MHNTKPKVTVNDDYIDLRNFDESHARNRGNSMSRKSPNRKNKSSIKSLYLKDEHLQKDKELINHGLKNLVTTYNKTKTRLEKNNQPRRIPCLNKKLPSEIRYTSCLEKPTDDQHSFKSKSDTSLNRDKIPIRNVSSSAPISLSKNITYSNAEKVEPFRNKFTMTGNEDLNDKIRVLTPSKRKPKPHSRSKSRDCDIRDTTKCVVQTPYQNGRKSNDCLNRPIDPRLKEKYSILHIPCVKRSWSIPIFSSKTSLHGNKCNDNVDRQTYLYDDGSEIESTYLTQKTNFNKECPREFTIVLFTMGAVCGILLASLLIYIIFGNDILHVFFKQREPPDASIKSYVKYVGGGLIYIITRFFKVMGEVLSIPVNKQEDYLGT
ncbi:uncharacterized protein [Diabrotica undecimpunctata]|uniref:uncharacterized protein isoform X1 n=1 Tax=Diabrotica undecimpunctata TaxID=50387 RepID=UPI003B6385A1